MPKRTAIGAFCTDVVSSTSRIEKFRETALKQHRIYLETVGRRFLRNVSKATKAKYQSGDIWVPGDALWGVIYPEPGKTYTETVTASLCHALYSLASGLSVANSSPLPPGLEAITTRSIFLAGPVIREAIFDNLRLYNGTALNACGRLEKWAKPNTIIAGFVLSDEGPLFDSVAQSPVINADEIKQCLMRLPSIQQSGYQLSLDIASSKGEEFIRFVGWQRRRELRGLVGCRVLVTTIKLVPRNQRGLDVTSRTSGIWNREEVALPSRDKKSRWELYELIDTTTSCKALKFVKQIYAEGDLEFHLPPKGGTDFLLKCHSDRFWPRTKTEPSGRIGRTNVVDFMKTPWCTLPTHRDPVSGNEKVLIQAYDKWGKKVLCFSKVSDSLLNRYEDYADFLDSASPCVEFSFG